jgi:hypothetical protein
VRIAGPQNLVDGIPVVGQQQQASGVLVQPANCENSLGVAHKIHHVSANSGIGGRRNSLGLVEQQVHRPRFLFGTNALTAKRHLISRTNNVSQYGYSAVDRYVTGLYGTVCFTAAAEPVAA